MIKSKMGNRYAPEFEQPMVELVRAGRQPKQLSKEFGCSVWSIRGWIKQADRDAGRGDGGLSSAEREELTKLKREVRQLKLGREILSKAAALVRTRGCAEHEAHYGFVKANQATYPVRVMCRLFGVSASGLCVGRAPALEAGAVGHCADSEDPGHSLGFALVHAVH